MSCDNVQKGVEVEGDRTNECCFYSPKSIIIVKNQVSKEYENIEFGGERTTSSERERAIDR